MSYNLILSRPSLASFNPLPRVSVLPIKTHEAQMTEGAGLWCLSVRKSHTGCPQHPSLNRWGVGLLTFTPAQALGDRTILDSSQAGFKI